MDKKRELVRWLISERLVKHQPDNPFTLSSGQISPWYIDCKSAMMIYETANLIAELMVGLIDEITMAHHQSRPEHLCNKDTIYVGSMADGGYALVSQIVTAWPRLGFQNDIQGFVMRKDARGHGLKEAFVGFPPDSLEERADKNTPIPVYLVDDVLTTGGSLMRLMARCVEENWMPRRIMPIVDRSVEGERHDGFMWSHVEPVLRMSDLT